MSQAPFTPTHAPTELFPWLPEHVVQESWAWYRSTTAIDDTVTIAHDGLVLDIATAEPDITPLADLAHRLSIDQVAAWLILTDLAARTVDLAGPLPHQHHWQADPAYLAAHSARPGTSSTTPVALALKFINSAAAGHAPDTLPDYGAFTIIATFTTLVHLLARSRIGRPALSAAPGPLPSPSRRPRSSP